MAYYRCGPTAIGNRTSWGPVSSPTVEKPYDRPMSGNFDRIFNAFERTNAFEYVRNSKDEERHIGHGDIVVNRKMNSSFERADCALAAQTPILEDEDFYREKILYSQARQLFPLQEDLADWINKTIGITYLNGENFLDVLDNGVELCQLAAVIHDKAREALDQGLIVGPVPQIRGRCWQRAARRSFFSRDNTENFLTFCRELGVHENLLFESDDLVLHNQPRQVILCLLEVARLATRFDIEPPGLVQLEKEIALEERDSGLDSAMSSAAWQFRDISPAPNDQSTTEPPSSPNPNENQLAVPDNADNESTKSEGTVASTDSDVPLKPTNELDKRVQLVTRLMERGCSCNSGSGRCSKLLKVKKVGEGRYNIAGRNVFIRLLKGRHMMVRVGGGWDTLEHFLSRHEPCQVRLVTNSRVSRDLTISRSLSRTSSKTSLKESSGTVSPVDSKASSVSGKSRTSTPHPKSRGSLRSDSVDSIQNKSRANLTLQLRDPVDSRRKQSAPIPSPSDQNKSRANVRVPVDTPRRKQSAPSLSTPSTPSRTVRTPTERKTVTQTATPKKSRSMSLALNQKDKFCGTERLNQGKAKVTASPAEVKKTRSQSIASTPLETRKPNNNRKTRSMSLASPNLELKTLSDRSASVTINGALTQAAIEETIRLSLAASIADDHSTNKPFLHIKAKYRSPPPREVPPR